ncbi:MAG: VOC family protein [Pseudomonadota bacterium]
MSYSIDHFVLTVSDPEASLAFYQRALGVKRIDFAQGRIAIGLGNQKINLHQAGQELLPHAKEPRPGSADFCLITTQKLEPLIQHLTDEGIPVLQGPVLRTGAKGPIESIYIRDPDGNLVELSNSMTQIK